MKEAQGLKEVMIVRDVKTDELMAISFKARAVKKIEQSDIPEDRSKILYNPAKPLGVLLFRNDEAGIVAILQVADGRAQIGWMLASDFDNDADKDKVDTSDVHWIDRIKTSNKWFGFLVKTCLLRINYEVLPIPHLYARIKGIERASGQSTCVDETENQSISSNKQEENENKQEENENKHWDLDELNHCDKSGESFNKINNTLSNAEVKHLSKECERSKGDMGSQADRVLDLIAKLDNEEFEKANSIILDVDTVYSGLITPTEKKIDIRQEMLLKSLSYGDRVSLDREFIENISVYYRKGLKTSGDMARYKAIVVMKLEATSENSIIAILHYDESKDKAVVEVIAPFGKNDNSNEAVERHYLNYLRYIRDAEKDW